MKLNSSTSIADQIQRESQLRGARTEEMPATAKRTQVVYNEDALMVHPDQVFSNPKNSRKTFDQPEIDSLAESMKVQGVGLLEPIIVRPRKLQQSGSGGALRQYEVIAGDRRLLAARRAELPLIPIIVRQADDRAARRINLIENIHRKELADNEMGDALVELKDDMQEELNQFLVKAHFVVSEEHDAIPLEIGTWKQAQKQFASLPTWMIGVIERAVARRERGVVRAPKVTWEDVAPEVGFSQVRSIHYYISISKLVEDEEDETEAGEESATDQETKKAVSDAISSGELSQQQSRALTALAPAQQKTLLGEIRSGNLSGPDAQKRAKELQGRGGGSSGGNSPRIAKDALSQLSALSLPSEQLRAAREVTEVVAKLRGAVEGRFTQYSPYDSQSKMEMRRQLKKMRGELEAIEALVAPSNAKERAHEEAQSLEMEEPALRLVG